MSIHDIGTFMCYQPKKFSKDHIELIAKINAIVQPYEEAGHLVTVRQVYYQLVHRNWIANKVTEYQRLVGILTDARMAGLVSWTAFEDRNRQLKGVSHVDGPPQAIKDMLADYALDLWANQDWRPEVWIEKKSLEGVISNICTRLRVDFFATAGYSSVTETWQAGQRFLDYIHKGQRPIIFYLGDHDPSGIDMTRHVQETVSTFVGQQINVVRIALNMDQVEAGGYPPNPAKLSDSRATAYIDRFGYESWELDVFTPDEMQDIIAKAILPIRDQTKWDEMVEEETQDKRLLEEVLEEKFGEWAAF
jgi:hypothetical protein